MRWTSEDHSRYRGKFSAQALVETQCAQLRVPVVLSVISRSGLALEGQTPASLRAPNVNENELHIQNGFYPQFTQIHQTSRPYLGPSYWLDQR